jgi:cytochrome oxidase Cu insertion factor (SCO1/SenC/PrrC family)
MKIVLTVVTLFCFFVLAGSARAQSSPLTPPALSTPRKAGTAALKVGDKAPDFALPNGDGKLVSLSELVSKGPVVIVFYRGFW